MANVASYKRETTLETDHKINLIYGLNGSGNSTLSNYLYDRENIEFSDCSIEPQLDDNTKVLVYNQSFINDNFYQCEAQPGIFSLSKENKEAQKRIASYNKELDDLKKATLTMENTLNLGPHYIYLGEGAIVNYHGENVKKNDDIPLDKTNKVDICVTKQPATENDDDPPCAEQQEIANGLAWATANDISEPVENN